MAPSPQSDFRVIESQGDFNVLLDQLRDATEYALDTEFHRERTYFPQVALVQIADRNGVYLVDALAVDLQPLQAILDGPATAIIHAARQDLEVLDLSCGTTPKNFFDTQIAAGFLGYTTPSLSTLLERELGVRAPKADRLTDWLRRPLGEAQLVYAAADVAHLLQVYDQLKARLIERGRLEWALEACQELREEPRGPREPDQVWRRIKEIRHLKGSSLAIAQRIAEWRERKAIETDVTPRFVLSDLGVVGIAASAPETLQELRSLRGVDGRNLRGSLAEELLQLVAQSREALPRKSAQPHAPELPTELKPAVPLISAWVSQQSRDLELETAILATRSDLEDLLRGSENARLAQGWRAEFVGEPIRKLVSGEASLAFDRDKGLILEVRSSSQADTNPPN